MTGAKYPRDFMAPKSHTRNANSPASLGHALWFKAETMHGKSYPEKQVFGVESIMDEMRLRNGCPWKGNGEAEMREFLNRSFLTRTGNLH
jgi:hypothetical protein